MDTFTQVLLEACTVLGQSIVFGAALALIVRVALQLLAPVNASTRFQVWFATLVVTALFPVTMFVAKSIPRSFEQATPKAAADFVRPTNVAASVRPLADARGSVLPVPTPMRPVQQEPKLQTRVLIQPDDAAALLGLYGFIVFVLAGRLGISYLRLRWMKRKAFPPPPEVGKRFAAWCSLCRTSRPVRIMLSAKAKSPMAVGFSKPAVIIPEALLLKLTGEELDHVGIHELAHLRRKDDWTNLAQQIIQALYFFNPAILWISRKLDFEREVACDDWVLTLTGHAKPYARSLTKVLEATSWRRGPVLASGAVFRKQQIIRRIEMMLDGSRDSRPNVSHVTLVVILMCILGAFSQIVRMPAVVEFANGGGGGFHRSKWSTDGRSVETESRGEIQFGDEDTSVTVMSPGGYFRVKESQGWDQREIQVRDDSSSQARLRYFVNGKERPLDDQGRAWMATVLPMVIRETGIDAERRAIRILEKRGPAGVFDEIDRIGNGHSKKRYLLAVISSATLNSEDLRRAMNRVGRISSDHDKAALLVEVADTYGAEQLRGPYFDALDTINSDHDRRSVLSKILEDARDGAMLTQAARSIERMQSDHDKAQLLSQASQQIASAPAETRRALMRAAASIQSDHEKAKVLTATLLAGRLPAPALEELLKVSEKIQSDHDKAQVLKSALEQDFDQPMALAAFFAVVRTINSSHDRSQLLSEVVKRHKTAPIAEEVARSTEGISSDHDKANVLSKLASDTTSEAVMNAVKSIGSDSDKRRVLEAMLEHETTPQILKSAIELAATIGSENDKANVLVKIAERHGGDPEVRDAVRKAAEKIGSDSDYRRIVSKLFAERADATPRQ
jgi:beta-lactamase regulating signal transducer with metallopeptidase domain